MHANAPLTTRGRLILVERIASGRPVAHVAAEMGISRRTADKWWRRWLVEGEAGLEDRSSRPRRCPHQTPARLERRIITLRQPAQARPGPNRRHSRPPHLDGAPGAEPPRLEPLGLDGPPERAGHPAHPH